uniref:FAM192A/Fyv6 N-terminal domain-containing protein n=1 Tax=Bionectria ochroleuca TaxID=29856 RepID=A0A0B7JKV6_BIOOC
MSDRFVSGGTIGGSAGEEKTTSADSAPSVSSGTKNAAQRREEQRRKAVEGEEKSLYEILQDNKAAKQAAFEEQSRLKNQFRALDDDEIEFLDEVRQKKRKEEEAVKRATEEGLRAFRAAQKGSGASVGAGTEKVEEPVMETESWGVGRKRKRLKEREVKGLKKKASGVEDKKEEGQGGSDQKHAVDSKRKEDEKPSMKPQSLPEKQEKPSLGLVGYGSDSDED